MHTSTLVHTTDTQFGTFETRADLSLALNLRTRDGDTTPLRTGRKSDLFSRSSDGRTHEVEVKRVAMCEAGHPVTSKAHKACS